MTRDLTADLRETPKPAVSEPVGLPAQSTLLVECLIDLDSKHDVLRITVITTVLTDKELMELYQLIALAASQDRPYSTILDLYEVERFPISAKTIRTLADSSPAVPKGTSRVIVAKQDVTYGLSRMFELVRDSMGGQLHVVRSLNEAYGLLGVNSEDFLQRLSPKASAT